MLASWLQHIGLMHNHSQQLFLVVRLRGPRFAGIVIQKAMCGAAPSFPSSPRCLSQRRPKGNKPLKSIHKNVFNCHWIPCGSSWMDKDWKGGCERKNNTGESEHFSKSAEQINRLSKTQAEYAAQGTHSSQTNLCYQPSSESPLSGNTGRLSLHTVPQLCINSVLPLWRAANLVMITKEPLLLNTKKLLECKKRNTLQPRLPLGKERVWHHQLPLIE